MKNHLFLNVNVSLLIPVPDGQTAESYYTELNHDDILDAIKDVLNGKSGADSYVRIYSVDEFCDEDAVTQ